MSAENAENVLLPGVKTIMMNNPINTVTFSAAWLKYLAKGYSLTAYWQSMGQGIYQLIPNHPSEPTPLTTIFKVTQGYTAKIKGKRKTFKTLRIAIKTVNAQFKKDNWIGNP